MLRICPFKSCIFPYLHEPDFLGRAPDPWVESAFPPNNGFDERMINRISNGCGTNRSILAVLTPTFPLEVQQGASHQQQQDNQRYMTPFHGFSLTRIRFRVESGIEGIPTSTPRPRSAACHFEDCRYVALLRFNGNIKMKPALTMILEVAHLTIGKGSGAEFEAAFRKAAPIISSMPGYISHQLRRCLEVPNRYILLVNWETLEAHTIGFRQSGGYQRWRELLHHFYDPFPTLEHYGSPLTDETRTDSRLI